MNLICKGMLGAIGAAALFITSVVHANDDAAAEAKPVKSLIPVEHFTRYPQMADMRLSPTGQYIAMTTPQDDGGMVLHIVDRVGMKPTATVRAGGNDVITTFWWATDERVVAAVGQREGGIDMPQPTGELFAINADGSRSTQLFGFRGSQGSSRVRRGGEQRYASAFPIQQRAPDGKRILVATWDWRDGGPGAGARAQIERLDIFSGRTELLGSAPHTLAMMLADHDGQVRLAFADEGYDERKVFIRADNRSEWQPWEVAMQDKERITPLMFARDNRHIYARIQDSEGAPGLYRLDLQTGKRDLLYRGHASTLDLLQTADGKDAYGVVTAEDRTGVHVFDSDSVEGRMTLALQNTFAGQLARFTSFSSDGKNGLVYVSSDRNPGDYYLFHLENREAEYLASPRNWIDPQRMAPMEPFSFKSRDGLTAHGYITRPLGSEGKKVPLIVNPHGGPHGVRDFWRFDPFTQFLASRGYAVMQVNFRGSGGYGYPFQAIGYRNWGTTMQDDVTDATHWAIEHRDIDPQKICLFGGSFGGYASLQGVVREPDLYRCAIGFVGVYDLVLMHRRGDIPKNLHGRRYLKLAVGDDEGDMRQRSPARNAGNIKADIMLAAGGRDERVPMAQYKAMTDALDAAGHPYESFVVDSEGHGFYKPEHNNELLERMHAFLQRSMAKAHSPGTPSQDD